MTNAQTYVYLLNIARAVVGERDLTEDEAERALAHVGGETAITDAVVESLADGVKESIRERRGNRS